MLFKIFLAGWVVLVIAILLNLLAQRIGITTWYPFIEEVGKIGVAKAFGKLSFLSTLFLFILYPALLGLAAFLVLKK